MPRSPHQQALLELLRDPPVRRGSGWYDDVDWGALLAYAGASLAPLVLRGLGTGSASVPPAVVEALAGRQDLMRQKRLLVAAVVAGACRALDAASVPFLVLKGAALAPLVYPDPALRPMSDIDLWLPRDRVVDALRALEAVGYRDSAQSELQAPVERETHEWRLVRSGAPLEIEIHTRLPSLDGIPWADFATAWRDGAFADLGGIRARVLNPEHLLTHVCLHLARRNLFASGLSHLVDVARITRRWPEAWDWPRMVADWDHQGIATWMLLPLVLARDLLDAAVPTGIEEEVAGGDWPAMLAIAEEQLWEGRAHRLPSAMRRTARFQSHGDALRWLRWRLFDHYWRSPEPRPPARVLADGLRRIGHDLAVKVPTYVRGLFRGELRGRRLALGRALERRRSELERLVAATRPGPRPDIATRPEGR